MAAYVCLHPDFLSTHTILNGDLLYCNLITSLMMDFQILGIGGLFFNIQTLRAQNSAQTWKKAGRRFNTQLENISICLCKPRDTLEGMIHHSYQELCLGTH